MDNRPPGGYALGRGPVSGGLGLHYPTTYTHSDRNPHSDRHPGHPGHGSGAGGGYPDRHRLPHLYSLSHAAAPAYRDTDSVTHAYCYPGSNTDAYTNSRPYAYTHAGTDSYPYSDPHADAALDADAPANVNPAADGYSFAASEIPTQLAAVRAEKRRNNSQAG